MVDLDKVRFCRDPIYAIFITLEHLFKNINPVPDRVTHGNNSKKQGEVIFDTGVNDLFVNTAADGATPTWLSLTQGGFPNPATENLNMAEFKVQFSDGTNPPDCEVYRDTSGNLTLKTSPSGGIKFE